MLFSTKFKITKNSQDDWFDPILSLDTTLFIDPLLIFEKPHNSFKSAPKKIKDIFNRIFELAAKSTGTIEDARHKQLLRILLFPEVKEICLGYSTGGTSGSGTGSGYSKSTLSAIYDSIEMGMSNIENFELLGIFNEGIGRDRISDITANIIKRDLIEYTQSVCQRHNIPMKPFNINHYEFNFDTNRWNNKTVELPVNPYFIDRAIILVPSIFIDEQPHINADDFKDFIWDKKNEEVRDEFSIKIKSDIDKHKIIEIARKFKGWMVDFKNNITNIFSYNLEKDPSGIYTTTIAGMEYANKNSLTINVTNKPTFEETVDKMISQYQNFIENNSGYKLLWNDDKTFRTERASQLVFTGILKSHCEANNIDISGEANLGRGPVDFKFSSGYQDRVAIEIKKASHKRFWYGLSSQLPKYMQSEDIKFGYFIIICLHEKDFKIIKKIEEEINNAKTIHKKEFKYKIIDATPDKLSASLL